MNISKSQKLYSQALQFMPGICLCRLLPAVQPGYSDSADFGLYAAGAAAH